MSYIYLAEDLSERFYPGVGSVDLKEICQIVRWADYEQKCKTISNTGLVNSTAIILTVCWLTFRT